MGFVSGCGYSMDVGYIGRYYGCFVLCVVVYGGWVGVFMCGLWGGMIRGFFNWGQVV